MAGVDELVAGMAFEPVLLVAHGVRARDEHDCLVAREPAHLAGLHQVALGRVVVAGGRRVRPARVVDCQGRERLLADGLRNLLVGLGRLAAQEQRDVAVVAYDLRLLLVVVCGELTGGLEDHLARDVPAAHDGDGLVEVGDVAGVGELVEYEGDVRGQLAAIALERGVARHVERLPHEDREQEVEGRVGVGHAREHGVALAGVAEAVDVHLVAREEILDLLNRKRLQAHVTADDDGLEGLPGGGLERLVVGQAEVVLRRYGIAGGNPAEGPATVVEAAVLAVEGLGCRDVHVAPSRLELVEQRVQRTAERLILLARLGERQQREQAWDVAVLRRAVVDEVGDERGVEQTLRVLPERVAGMVLVARGVLDEALDEREYVSLGAHVLDGVVFVGLAEVDGAELPDLVPGGGEHVAHVVDERALWEDLSRT